MRALFVALMLVWALPALALDPNDRLADPAQEARAHAISAELRCLVCQNQSIEDSDADLAKELRRIVRERIAAGDSDARVKDYLVARYGEFVLLNPVWGAHTMLLWLAAPVLLLIGAIVLLMRRRGSGAMAPEVALSAEERAALQRLEER